MIKVKHPLDHCNRAQIETIQQLPEAVRRSQELFYSYANAVYRYHQEAAAHEPTHQDYEEWLEGLPENVARGMRARGFEECRTVLSFTRYVQEKNDVGLEAYVRGLMGEEEHEEYKELTA
jgi:hypothetical protein